MQNPRKTKKNTALEQDKKLVEKALKKYLKNLKGPEVLKKAMRYAVFAGGKRLRPVLTVESSRVLKGDRKTAIPFACAVELVHNFSLVHDDLPSMDNDDLRRGKPTCHKLFGEGVALLAGCALLNLAFGILADVKSDKALSAIKLLSLAVGEEHMIGGQTLDLLHKDGVNRKLKKKIDHMKTASLMALSCSLGAVAAGADTKDLKRVKGFGAELGYAFQVADDLDDSNYDKTTVKKMRDRVKSHIDKAKKYISPFGKNGRVLNGIADMIKERAET